MDGGVIQQTLSESVAWLVRPLNKDIAGACVYCKVSLIFVEDQLTLCRTEMVALASGLMPAGIIHGVLSKQHF